MRPREAALATLAATLIWTSSPSAGAQVLATPSGGSKKSEAPSFEVPATKTGLNFDFAVRELQQSRRCTIEKRRYEGADASGDSVTENYVADCPSWAKKQDRERGRFVMLTVLSAANERKDRQSQAPTNDAQKTCLIQQVNAFETAATAKPTRDILEKLFGAKEAKFTLIDDTAGLINDDTIEYGFKCGAADAALAIQAVINSKKSCATATPEQIAKQVQDCARVRFSATQLDPLLSAKPKADPRSAQRKNSAKKDPLGGSSPATGTSRANGAQ